MVHVSGSCRVFAEVWCARILLAMSGRSKAALGGHFSPDDRARAQIQGPSQVAMAHLEVDADALLAVLRCGNRDDAGDSVRPQLILCAASLLSHTRAPPSWFQQAHSACSVTHPVFAQGNLRGR